MTSTLRVVSKPGIFTNLALWTEESGNDQPQFSKFPIRLPGYGLPLHQKSPFPSATDEWYANPITVRERLMLRLMAQLKDKPNWQSKVFDEDIIREWRSEALRYVSGLATNSESQRSAEGLRVIEATLIYGSERQKWCSEKMFDFCIAELRDSATRKCNIMTEVIDANATVYISDTAVTFDVKQALKDAVALLERVPESEKDWHPGSFGKVLDIVHPSLFPLIYGRTKILSDEFVPLKTCSEYSGKGEIVAKPRAESVYYSDKFQWLPCDVKLDDRGAATITSYINNLHPVAHEALYSVIERVISQSLPLWINCLISTVRLPNEDRMEAVGDGYIHNEVDWDHINDKESFKVPEPKEYGTRTRGSDADLYWQAAQVRKQMHAKGFQVIVKLANIHLTPEKPRYTGGSWHIEGKSNEHICASALYYYDEENITTSYLAFREGFNHEILENRAEQSREWALCDIYGIKDHWESALQILGEVHTRENRLLALPNVLQHMVSPFELIDRTKPGHRKLLALFLVDPYVRIPSTANVPPQQAHWWAHQRKLAFLSGRFPNEIWDQIMEDVDFPIRIEEAKQIREQLIDERRQFVAEVEEIFSENGYCFCEH